MRRLFAAALFGHIALGSYVLDPETGEKIGDVPDMGGGMPDFGPIATSRKLMCQACVAATTESYGVISDAWKKSGRERPPPRQPGARKPITFKGKEHMGRNEEYAIETIEKNFCMNGIFRAYSVFPPELAKNCQAFMDEWNDDFQVERILTDARSAKEARSACKDVCETIPRDQRMPKIDPNATPPPMPKSFPMSPPFA